jgi:hypothetical protein
MDHSLSPDNGSMKWNRTQLSAGPGSELRKYDDGLLTPSLRIPHMPAWMAKGIAGLGGACRVQFRKSDGYPGKCSRYRGIRQMDGGTILLGFSPTSLTSWVMDRGCGVMASNFSPTFELLEGFQPTLTHTVLTADRGVTRCGMASWKLRPRTPRTS